MKETESSCSAGDSAGSTGEGRGKGGGREEGGEKPHSSGGGLCGAVRGVSVRNAFREASYRK